MKVSKSTAVRYYIAGQTIRINAVTLLANLIRDRRYGEPVNNKSLLTFNEQCKLASFKYPGKKLEYCLIQNIADAKQAGIFTE